MEDYAKTFNLVDDEDGDLVDAETQHENSGNQLQVSRGIH